MHPRLLALYNQELAYVREMGSEFARQFPKIASRLSLDGMEVADPYVERLLEGFAFLSARIHLKMEAEFPRFVQTLLEVVYPNLVAPVPSMAIARLVPNALDTNLPRGARLEPQTALRATNAAPGSTACQFRTAHPVTLWPIEIAQVRYFSYAPDLPLAQVPLAAVAKGGLRIRLRAFEGVDLRKLPLDSLTFFISAPDDAAYRLHELLLGHATGLLGLPAQRPAQSWSLQGRDSIRQVGFEDDEAILPMSRSGLRGYRLLQEFAALPQRVLFFALDGIGDTLSKSDGREAELVVLFDRGDSQLESLIDDDSVSLHCTPVVNLFQRRLDRVMTQHPTHEYHVVADRTRTSDFEIVRILGVTGIGNQGGETLFEPLYTSFSNAPQHQRAFFTIRREPRLFAQGAKREEQRSAYRGSEVYISLIGPDEAVYDGDVRQLGVDALCSNRDLPTLMPRGGIEPRGRKDFTLDVSAPVNAVQCLRGPTRPQASADDGLSTWSMVTQLSMNLLSALDLDEHEGASTLRRVLALYGPPHDAAWRKLVDGILSVSARRLVRRLPFTGPLTFGTGVEITVTIDDLAFQGSSAFAFASVLDRLFARHAAINSFVQTRLVSQQRGDVMRWPPRAGTRPIA